MFILISYAFRFLYGDQARFFGDEIRLELKHNKMGMVAMASGGENLNASQVFIYLFSFLFLLRTYTFYIFFSYLTYLDKTSYLSR